VVVEDAVEAVVENRNLTKTDEISKINDKLEAMEL
jgi:hypothetical protein